MGVSCMRSKAISKYLLLITVFLFLSAAAYSQVPDDDDATRDLVDTAFMKKRPAGKRPARRTQQSAGYRFVSKRRSLIRHDKLTASAVVGVTIWRLRPSKASDDQEVRQLIHKQGEWTPERVSGSSPLTEGSRVQLTIESPRAGYLYVFDREVYADGTFGEPYLIFPTLNINSGDNKVSAGRIIEIPSAEDDPPFYTLTRSRADHDGEALTVIVSDTPLTDVSIGRTAQKVSNEQFAAYETKWGAMTEQLELDKGAGKPMSKAEKSALAGNTVLTQTDSPPQTIYRVLVKPDQPLLVTVPLSISTRAKAGS